MELIFRGSISVTFVRKCGDLHGLVVPSLSPALGRQKQADLNEARPVCSEFQDKEGYIVRTCFLFLKNAPHKVMIVCLFHQLVLD